MSLLNLKRAIGTFPSYQAAEQALIELRDGGYAMERVSLIGKETDPLSRSGLTGDAQIQDIKQDNYADDGAKTGAATGGAIGSLAGLLVGLGALVIPGVGPIVLAGAVATAIATAVAGGAIGAATGGLLGGLVGLGIPEDRAQIYSDQVSHGNYLVMIDGTNDEIAHVESILKRRGIHEWYTYSLPDQSKADQMNLTDRTIASSSVIR